MHILYINLIKYGKRKLKCTKQSCFFRRLTLNKIKLTLNVDSYGVFTNFVFMDLLKRQCFGEMDFLWRNINPSGCNKNIFSFEWTNLIIQLGSQFVTFRFSIGHTSSRHANSYCRSELTKLSNKTKCKTSSHELVFLPGLLHLGV